MSGENDALEFDPGDPAANLFRLKQQPLPNPNGICATSSERSVLTMPFRCSIEALAHCSAHWVSFWDARLE
jgi:hypothetical protein